ncbi:hypothetical protein GMJAKD_00435 [Candidatus Electrothrix aarhusensis]
MPDIGLNDRIIKEWGKDITQQDGQHHSFRVSRVDHPDQDGQGPDKKAVAPSTDIGMRGRDRVRGHEDEAEGETAQDRMPVKGQVDESVGRRGNELED